ARLDASSRSWSTMWPEESRQTLPHNWRLRAGGATSASRGPAGQPFGYERPSGSWSLAAHEEVDVPERKRAVGLVVRSAPREPWLHALGRREIVPRARNPQ